MMKYSGVQTILQRIFDIGRKPNPSKQWVSSRRVIGEYVEK